jgi:redox-sensing transcriptional repressor
MTLPHNTIERLFLYRRILQDALADNKPTIFSHELAHISGSSSEQVRRDLMLAGAEGNRRLGYDCEKLLTQFSSFFKTNTTTNIAIVGVGNIGKAIASYFLGKKPHIDVIALFDNDPAKHGRVIHGTHCYPANDLERVLKSQVVHVGVVAVPSTTAQDIADKLVQSGVPSLLNFAPVRLKVPPPFFVEDMDMTLSIEKLGFFAKSLL